jgi:uncharacterized protein (TIGR02271 family)
MNTDRETLTLHEGMAVFGAEGEKLGSVDHVEGDYVVAKKGWLFPTDFYLPSSAVSAVDEDRLILNVTKDQVLNQGWDIPPSEREGSATMYDDGGAIREDESYLGGATNAGAAPLTGDGAFADPTRAAEPFDHAAKHETAHADNAESIRVPLTEEELTATTRPVERGQVRIDKDVVTEERGLDVPVTEERINVSRRTVDRDLREGETLLEDDTIVVPVRGEEVDLQKRAHVTEEIEVSKEAVQETRHVSDKVRHERARVSDTTGDIETDKLDRKKKKS